jgi:hypothetical protein
MPSVSRSNSFLYANFSADAAYNRINISSNGLRRSPRLINKSYNDNLVKQILRIPIYVPNHRAGSSVEEYSQEIKFRDSKIIANFIQRGEKLSNILSRNKNSRDIILARIVNIACIYVYLCLNPALLKVSPSFLTVAKNKRDEFLKSTTRYRTIYKDDSEFQKTCDIFEALCKRIARHFCC